ncbi:MAG: flocculation-associated PEP-CTERM protein PepA [Burkholderiaceae bacterium]
MKIPLHALSLSVLHRTAIATALAAACFHASALPEFTLDPSSAGLAGSAFTADNILISNYSTTTIDPGGSFTESGYLAVTAFQLGGTTFTPTGLNGSYGIYVAFTGSGTTAVGNPTTSALLGSFSSIDYTMYAYNGAATFGFSGTTPTENASGEIAIARGSLISGTVASIPSGDGATFNPSANAKLTLEVLQPGFFPSPSPFYTMALTSFSNTTSEVQPFAGGFMIRQGGGSLNFASPVPEPTSLSMLLAGLVAAGFVARRRGPDRTRG